MKRREKAVLLLFLILCLLPFGVSASVFRGGKTGESEAKPRYSLSADGECVIDDVSFDHARETADNCRVFYEIFVGSFSDSDGDGVGDLRGIIDRLDYLNDGCPDSGLSLGVEGIWLTPVFQSPSYHKYDVTDYYKIDPAFGTADDLKELLDACHERGMLVILDLPINHTGKENRWFKNFSNAHVMHNSESPYYNFYTWIPYGGASPAGRHFIRLGRTEAAYECNFSDDMPELNFDDPSVRQSVLDVALHYLALGVDGFRFDAAKYIYYGDHAASVDFWTWYIGELKAVKPDIYTVAEVWDADGITDKYVPAVNCFNFTLSQTDGLICATAKGGNADKLTGYTQSYLRTVKALNPDAMNIPFIANHDMDRAAGYLLSSNGTAQMAANLYLLSPGSPFIYYGEEIGLRGSRGGANTDANRRLRMRWGDGDPVADPAGANYDEKKQTANTVSSLLSDEKGLYNYYKRLIMIRKANPEIARGEYRALPLPDTKAGGFTCTWEGNTVAVLHNPTSRPVTIALSDLAGGTFTVLAASAGMNGAGLENGVLTLGAQTSAVLR